MCYIPDVLSPLPDSDFLKGYNTLTIRSVAKALKRRRPL
jgi:hypothetical protein